MVRGGRRPDGRPRGGPRGTRCARGGPIAATTFDDAPRAREGEASCGVDAGGALAAAGGFVFIATKAGGG